MLTVCIRRAMTKRSSSLKNKHCCRTRSSSSSTEGPDQFGTLLQLCVDRYYVSPGQANTELFRRGVCCNYGPLGTELRRNLLDQWWRSVTRSRAQVFGINTNSGLDRAADGQEPLRIVDYEHLKQLLERQELSKEQLIQEARLFLQRCPSVRTNLLQGNQPNDIFHL